IDIKSSCCVSQLLMFTNRSVLPGTPATAFDAKSESPRTAMRICGFLGASAGLSVDAAFAAGAGAGASGASIESVRPSVIGPLWSPDFSSSDTLPDERDLMSDSDQLRSLDLIRSA